MTDKVTSMLTRKSNVIIPDITNNSVNIINEFFIIPAVFSLSLLNSLTVLIMKFHIYILLYFLKNVSLLLQIVALLFWLISR